MLPTFTQMVYCVEWPCDSHRSIHPKVTDNSLLLPLLGHISSAPYNRLGLIANRSYQCN